jgi:transcriptional regulator with GAF, ATPase, and Fis domain
LLQAYSWPGNVRELAAVIERAAILGRGNRLDIAAALGFGTEPSPDRRLDTMTPAGEGVIPVETLDASMRRHVERALQATGGRIEGPHGAAVRLGVNPHTLRGRMRRLGLSWSAFRGLAGGSAGRPNATDAIDAEVSGALPGFDAAMREHIQAALSASYGRIEGPLGAAARLGLNPHTLRARMRKLGIDWRRYRLPAGQARP